MNNKSLEYMIQIVKPAFFDTLFMVFFTTLLSAIFGFLLGIILVVTDEKGLKPNKTIYRILDVVINIVRSFPFVILMVSIIPFTRLIAGTSIGKTAALVPLTLASTPMVARLIESNLKEVSSGLIEAGKSFGASDMQIIFKIIIPEAVSSIINSLTFVVISVLGATAVAGTVGAGGLGSVAITYGYQSFNDTIMYGIVIILIVLVQIIQAIGSFLYKKS